MKHRWLWVTLWYCLMIAPMLHFNQSGPLQLNQLDGFLLWGWVGGMCAWSFTWHRALLKGLLTGATMGGWLWLACNDGDFHTHWMPTWGLWIIVAGCVACLIIELFPSRGN